MTQMSHNQLIQNIINQGVNQTALLNACRNLIDDKGRTGGLAAYRLLSLKLESGLTGEAEEQVMNVLDALTGQCHVNCQLGTSDYHLQKPAA